MAEDQGRSIAWPLVKLGLIGLGGVVAVGLAAYLAAVALAAMTNA